MDEGLSDVWIKHKCGGPYVGFVVLQDYVDVLTRPVTWEPGSSAVDLTSPENCC